LEGHGRATTALVAAGAAAAVAGLVAAVSCIPDLPSSGAPADTGTGTDAGDAGEAGNGEAAAPSCGDGIIHLELGEQCDPGPFGDAAALQGCTRDCRMDCDGGIVWSGNNHCYRLADNVGVSNIGSAESRCTVPEHVVTFASEAELEAGVGLLDAGAFWLGLEYVGADPAGTFESLAPYEPGWSSACRGCYAHAPDPSRPLPGDGGCVRAQADLARSWDSIPCSGGLAHKVICEREPAGRLSTPCDAGDCFELKFTLNTKRYVFVHGGGGALADEAERGCAAMGGSLVVLRSRDEREQLWREISRIGAGFTAFWVGLSLADGGTPDGGPWGWDDDAGEDAYPSEWAGGQPGGAESRAYLFVNPMAVSDSLATNEFKGTAPLKVPYVCQLPW
jgi:hypothetical protein